MVTDGSLAAVHLFFPDPWPKKRHHKRRLVQAPFVALLKQKLRPGGIVHAATDWPDYAVWIEEAFSGWQKASRGFAERPTTKFEARGQKLGHAIRDLYFKNS
jgi:tRNA (guanine-N7-)-methyltransferase